MLNHNIRCIEIIEDIREVNNAISVEPQHKMY